MRRLSTSGVDRSGGVVSLPASDQLRRMAEIAEDLGARRVHDDALALADRITGGRFYIACLGQFKRGKSTLIDALLDDPVLPVGTLPVTAIPTIVRHGSRRGARVRVAAENRSDAADAVWHTIDPDELAMYVSEEHNPENSKRVSAVEVFVPSPLLASGMCLVDTPGLGSVFENNTTATLEFIPQIDAAIVVIGADPPLTGDELALIADVSEIVSQIVFVLNKADKNSDDERSCAVAFASSAIERRLGRPVSHIFQVSATERLHDTGPPRDWEAFVEALTTIGGRSCGDLVREAEKRGISRMAGLLLATARRLHDALLRPVEENEEMLRGLAATVTVGEHAIADLGVLFASERSRLATRLAAERSRFLATALPAALANLEARATTLRTRVGPRYRRRLMHEAQSVARDILFPWFTAQQVSATDVYRDVMERHVVAAKGLLERLANSGVPELEQGQDVLATIDLSLGSESLFVFNDVMHVAEPASPIRFIADIVLGAAVLGLIEREAAAFLEWLLEMNSSRVENSVVAHATESQRELERELRAILDDAQHRGRALLAHAAEVQATGDTAVHTELRRLNTIEAELRTILDATGAPA